MKPVAILLSAADNHRLWPRVRAHLSGIRRAAEENHSGAVQLIAGYPVRAAAGEQLTESPGSSATDRYG